MARRTSRSLSPPPNTGARVRTFLALLADELRHAAIHWQLAILVTIGVTLWTRADGPRRGITRYALMLT